MWAYQVVSQPNREGSRPTVLGTYATHASALEKVKILMSTEKENQDKSTKCHFCPLYFKTDTAAEREENQESAKEYCESCKLDDQYNCSNYRPKSLKTNYRIEAIQIIE